LFQRAEAAAPLDGPVLRGARLLLRPFGPDDVDERYLGWLNDPVVNAHSRRLGSRSSAAEARLYLASLGPDERVLGIHHHALGHVGNLKYGPIDRADSRADVSILIGERDAWGQGIGREAVYLVTRHLFLTEGLNRVDAGSGNPAFVRLVLSLGWRAEGEQHERVRIGGHLVDWTLLAQLRREFVERPEFHAEGAGS
jgi:RimJ/RimL family protein N-acetyltransferase